MFSSNIAHHVVNDILAQGVPALSHAAGIQSLTLPDPDKNYDADANKPNGWGRSGEPYNDGWLHSDIKNMAYYYTHMLFDELVTQGEMK